MSYYTQVFLRLHLTDAMPAQVLATLHALVNREIENLPTLPDHKYFRNKRWRSFFHWGDGTCRLVHDAATNRYLLESDNTGNYAPYDQFLDWIDPYVAPQQDRVVLGAICHEDGPGEILTLVDGQLKRVHHVLREENHVRIYTSVNFDAGAFELNIHSDGSVELSKLDGKPIPDSITERFQSWMSELLDELPAELVETAPHTCNQRSYGDCCKKARRLVRPA
ncbi:MAG TPA: hypothetical protein V6C81_12690 [Planktothrix sp.]|jgi:hypothetical protein